MSMPATSFSTSRAAFSARSPSDVPNWTTKRVSSHFLWIWSIGRSSLGTMKSIVSSSSKYNRCWIGIDIKSTDHYRSQLERIESNDNQSILRRKQYLLHIPRREDETEDWRHEPLDHTKFDFCRASFSMSIADSNKIEVDWRSRKWWYFMQ